MRKTSGVAIGAEDRCAFVVIDEHYKVLSEGEDSAYRVFWKKDKFHEEVIEQKPEMTPVAYLTTKLGVSSIRI